MKLAAALIFAAATLWMQPALAACTLREQPTRVVEVESAAATSGLTQNRGEWNEQSLTAVDRNGRTFSLYGRAAEDQRFGSNDPSYEAGTYVALAPKVTADVEGSFSPTHLVLPETTMNAGVDVRTNAGYGFQLHDGARTFPDSHATILALGGDRYFKQNRIAIVATFATLSTVPGTAVSEGAVFARYLPCDTESFAISTGRDVELAGVGRVNVYHAVTYDANVVHWLSNRIGVDMGAGWNLLIGAYDRLEVRFGIRARL